MRHDGRLNNEIRKIEVIHDFLIHADGSVLIKQGNTWVLCAVTIEDDVPPFIEDETGWITAEYAMLPCSANTRIPRESRTGKVKGRTMEIQRLIGRSLRAVTDLSLLGRRTIRVDCDVIQADGGTRTASITGAYLALRDAIKKLIKEGILENDPLIDSVAAISVGVVDDEVIVDLDYQEDSSAKMDANFILTGKGRIVEIQATAEDSPIDWLLWDKICVLGIEGVKAVLKSVGLKD